MNVNRYTEIINSSERKYDDLGDCNSLFSEVNFNFIVKKNILVDEFHNSISINKLRHISNFQKTNLD